MLGFVVMGTNQAIPELPKGGIQSVCVVSFVVYFFSFSLGSKVKVKLSSLIYY